jgi:hypothetical protein
MPSMLKSISPNALHLLIASFLVVPVVVTMLLLPPKLNETQNGKTPESEMPLSSKIAKKGNIDDQRGSPLFSVLPPEIRNRIFAFACTAFETIPYTPNDWFYRPGYHAHRRISATLLATCKRIYLEAFTLPLRLNEHVFWGSIERGPPRRYSGVDNYKRTDLNAFFDCLTLQQRFNVQEVHLFFQQFWLEDLDLTSGRVATKKIKLTLRHQDWYFWEDIESLGICPWLEGRVEADDMEREKDMVPSLPRDLDRYLGWGRQFEFVCGLEELEIEFETLSILKEVELDPIITFAKRWEFPLMGNGVLGWDKGSGLREYTWTGSKLLRGELDEPIFDLFEDTPENMSEGDHDFGTDSPAYESGSTYEYSDWGDEPSSFAEQEGNALTNVAGPSHAASALQLHDDEDNSSHPAPEALSNSQEPTQPVIYAPPQILDADDAQEVEDQASASFEQAEAVQPAIPLLALESNVQDYYVVSMIWRKRK